MMYPVHEWVNDHEHHSAVFGVSITTKTVQCLWEKWTKSMTPSGTLPEGEFFAIAQRLFPTAVPFRLHAGHECDTEDCDAEAGVKARKVTYIAGKRLPYEGISALSRTACCLTRSVGVGWHPRQNEDEGDCGVNCGPIENHCDAASRSWKKALLVIVVKQCVLFISKTLCILHEAHAVTLSGRVGFDTCFRWFPGVWRFPLGSPTPYMLRLSRALRKES